MSASTPVPFGIAVAARQPVHTVRIDESALVWDTQRQIMLVRDGAVLVPWMRHTDGVTNTDSNTDGSGGRETDEDHRED